MHVISSALNVVSGFVPNVTLPPLLRETAKAVALVAGFVLCFRYAPKTTIRLVLVAVGAFFYAATFRSLPYEDRQDSLENTFPNIDLNPSSVSPDPIKFSLEPALSSLGQIRVLAMNMQQSKLNIDLLFIFQFLYKNKPKRLKILNWNPCVPGHPDFSRRAGQDNDPLREAVQTLTANVTRLVEISQMELNPGIAFQVLFAINRDYWGSVYHELVPESSFMDTLYFLCAVLGSHECYLDSFYPNIKKREDLELPPYLQDEGFKRFVVAVIWLSKHEAAVEHIKTTFGPDVFKAYRHPLEKVIKPREVANYTDPVKEDRSWGQKLFTHLKAMMEWFLATQDSICLDDIRTIKKEIDKCKGLKLSVIPESPQLSNRVLDIQKAFNMGDGPWIAMMDCQIAQFVAKLPENIRKTF